MAEEVKAGGGVTPDASGGAPPAKEAVTYAGKFTDEAALYKGVAEIRKAHGLPDIPPENIAKMYGDPKAAEAEYTALHSALGKRAKEAPKTGTLLDTISPPTEVKPAADDGVDVPIQQVLAKAGLTNEQVYSEWVQHKGEITADTLEKLRVNHPDYSRIPKASAYRIIKDEINQQSREVDRVGKEAAAVVGSAENLKVLLSEREKYVPANERASIDKMLMDQDLFVQGVRLVNQYKSTAKPAERTTVTGDRSPAATDVSNRKLEVSRLLNENPHDPALVAEFRALTAKR